MSREILFKAKRIDNGEWVEGYLFFIVDTPYIICEGETMCMDGENTDLYATEWYEVDETTICQYTGLKDKNGNKIWDNDIVKLKFREGRIGSTEKDYNFVVRYDDIEASWEFEEREGLELIGHPLFTQFGQHTYEVIGNIFDNPELVGVVE